MKVLSGVNIHSCLLVGVMVPVILTAITIAWISVSRVQANGQAELQRLQERLMATRKDGLKNLVDTATSVVLEAKNNSALSEAQAKQEARSRIRSIIFGNDNYVSARQRDGFNLAYHPDPAKEGPTESHAAEISQSALRLGGKRWFSCL